MTHDRDDDTVRRALHDLRDADAAATPALDAVLARQRPTVSLDFRRAAAFAMAASVVLACTTVITRIALRPPRLVVPAEVLALSAWQPMTDALLEGLPDVIGDAPLTASLLPMVRLDTTMERTP